MRWNVRKTGGPAGPSSRLCLALALATWLVPSSLSAQVLSGQVTEAGSGVPVSAALVELVREDSSRVAGVLSDDRGLYRVVAPEFGTYRVRIRRLGYATRLMGPVTLVGEERLDVSLPAAPIQLEGISATATSRCEAGPGVGPDTQVLWNLISGALAATVAAQEQELFEFELHRFLRDMTVDRDRILLEGVERIRSSRPFEAYDLRSLTRDGYVEPVNAASLAYYMPDPSVMVSDDFLEDHCFRVVDATDPGVVGLGFHPAPDRVDDTRRSSTRTYRDLFGRDVVEVGGVLWVDRETGALRELEYDYVGFQDPVIARHAGGTARFERIAGGYFVVRQWSLRTPRLEDGEDDELRVTAIREEGGFLIEALDGAGRSVVPDLRGGDVIGRIAPGDLRVPVADVVVRLSGSPFATVTDESGRFAFRGVPPGPYLATWWAPRLDSIGVPAAVIPVEVSNGIRQEIELPGPDAQSVLDELCAGMEAGPDLGVVRVRLTTPSGRLPVNQPTRLRSAAVADRETPPPLDVATLDRLTPVDSDGTGIFCSVPTGYPVTVTAPPGDTVGVTLTLPPGGIELVEMRIDRTRR